MLWRVRLVNLDVSNAFAFALIVRFVPGQAVESIFNFILRIRNVPIKLQRVVWHHSLPNCNSPFSKQIWVVWRTNSPSRVVWVRSSKSKRWSQRPCQMWRLRSGFCGEKRRIGSNENRKIGSWTNGFYQFYPFEHLFSTYWWSQRFSWCLTWEQRETTFQCCRKPCHHHPDGHPRRRPCRTLPMRVLAGGLKIKRKPTMMVRLCQCWFFPLWWSFLYDGKTIFVPPLFAIYSNNCFCWFFVGGWSTPFLGDILLGPQLWRMPRLEAVNERSHTYAPLGGCRLTYLWHVWQVGIEFQTSFIFTIVSWEALLLFFFFPRSKKVCFIQKLCTLSVASFMKFNVAFFIDWKKKRCTRPFFVDVYLKQCTAVIPEDIWWFPGILWSFAALVQVVTCSCRPGWGPADLLFLDKSFVTSLGPSCFLLDKTEMI